MLRYMLLHLLYGENTQEILLMQLPRPVYCPKIEHSEYDSGRRGETVSLTRHNSALYGGAYVLLTQEKT